MGALKDMQITARNERDYGRARSVTITNARALTWEDIETLTDGLTGTFSGPCPYCAPDKRSSARFRVERPSLSVARWHCFYCGERGALRSEHQMDAAAETAARAADARSKAERAEKTSRALHLWEAAGTVIGSPVIEYLRARAIRDLPPDVDQVLRYHPACDFGLDGRRPCMLALLRDVKTDEPRAIHRTWIAADGKALGRMALGPIARAAVKLWPSEGPNLVIAEGIETTLAAALHLQRGDGTPLRPAWALTVAQNMAAFPLVRRIQNLTVLVDHDQSGTGQRAAAACAEQWCNAGRRVTKLMPETVGCDFNDIVLARGIK